MIRKANINDTDQIAHLFDLYRIFYRKTSDLDQAKKFISERITQQDSTIFIFEKKNSIVGFVQLYPIFSSTRMQKMWLLNDLYVLASERGLNIGVALLKHAQFFAKETKTCGLLLETEKTNVIGNKLYPKLGFELIDSSNFYFWETSL